MRRTTVGGANAALRSLHRRCVGCETQGRPGRSGRPILLHPRSGNRRRRSRRRGAATAIEWRTVRREPRAVVRSTLPEAEAAVSAVMRTPVHGGRAPRSARTSAGAPGAPQAGTRRHARVPAAAQPARRARRGLRRVRREAPSRGERSERPASCRELRHGVACSSASGARSERQRAEATGIAAEIGAKRRLQRKARPRSGSPRLFVWIPVPVPASIIDTIDTITVCTLVVSIRCMVTSSTGIPGISIDEIAVIGSATIVVPNTGNVIGVHRTLSSSVARR